MARLLLCVLALCATGAFADPRENYSKLDAKVLKERQVELLALFSHIHEPINIPKCREIANSWSLELNYDKYSNLTAAKTYVGMMNNFWYLPRAVPFSVNEPAHAFEAMTLFNVLYSAKDYDTFYKTAVYLRDRINEGLFVYVFSISIIYRMDTQGIILPPIYETFPSYFNNGEVMVTAQRINTHGSRLVNNYPTTYTWDDNIVIRWNETVWPYLGKGSSIEYFTNDYALNAGSYFVSLVSPFWLGDTFVPVIYSERRGETWWYIHRQIVARYYMERLSNGLGEISEIGDVVKEGYVSGLLYHNGIPFPSRPNYFYVNQPDFEDALEEVKEFENRIWEAIDKGFYINRKGEHVSLLTDSGIEVLGRLIESNADSPNRYLYKDFIRLWKQILGNSIKPGYVYTNSFTPLVAPSALENYQTALRDPAYYMLWKRILKLFVHWQKQMPLYKPEDLSAPVTIEKVEVEKLVTYFENSYLNLTNHLFQNYYEVRELHDDVKVLVQRPRLNHKPFTVRVSVKSDVAQKVIVKFFLAPKYDSNGFEIPLHRNTENFFMLDHFIYDLTAGDCVITRKSTDYVYTSKGWPSTEEIYENVAKGEWVPTKRSMNAFPHHLLLPKGKVGGMKFQFVVYIQAFDPTKQNTIGYPSDRPLYSFQVKGVKNLWFQDVVIYHKEAPEVSVPLTF